VVVGILQIKSLGTRMFMNMKPSQNGEDREGRLFITKSANFYKALLRSKEEEIHQNSQERLSLIVQR
jgi:hypothetical protein